MVEIAHAIAASVFCDGIVWLRIEPPTIVLYRDIAVSTKLRFV